MLIILRYPSGRRVDGILLAAAPDRMRVIIQRLNDTIELRRLEERWVDPYGRSVEVDGWVSDGNPAATEFSARMGERVQAAS